MKKIFKLLRIALKYIIFAFTCVGKLFFWRRLPREQRKTTVIAASFVLVPLLILIGFTLMNAGKAQAAWYDDTFQYRQRVDVTNSATLQTDTQVSITLNTSALITAGKMQPSCNDIRVVDQTGKLLPHVVEEGSSGCNTTSTNIWVKLSSIPTTAISLWVYYGNPSAPNIENGDLVFIFYDNFNASTLNSNKWTATSTTSLASGAITVSQGSLYTNQPIGTDSAGIVYEYREKFSNTLGSFSGLMIANANGTAGANGNSNKLIYMMTDANASIAQRGWAADGTAASYNLSNNATLYTPSANTYNIDGFSMTSTQIKFLNNGAQTGSTVTGSWSANPYLWIGYLLGSNSTTSDNTDVTVDWVRVRKLLVGITVTVSGSEEKTQGPMVYWKFDDGQGNFANNSVTSDITSNLMAYYKMDESSWAGTAGEVKDATGNGNNGTAVNGATTTSSGKYINAGSFDGTNDQVQINDSPSVSVVGGGFTMAAWVYPTVNNVYQTILIKGAGDGSNRQYAMFLSPSSQNNVFVHLNGPIVAQDYAMQHAWQTNAWNHLVVTYDGANMRLYLNGVLEVTQAGSGPIFPVAGKLYLGEENTILPLNGREDDVRIYNRALTSQQVAALYGTTGEGTLLGSAKPTWQQENMCISGKCLLFNGSAAYVQANATGSANLNQTSPFTFGAWVKTTTTGVTQYIFNKQENVTNEFAIAIYLDASNQVTVETSKQGSSVSKVTGRALSVNQWYYLTVTSDGSSSVSIYVNGQLSSAGSLGGSGGTTSIGQIFIGSSYIGGVFFKGFMDDVKLYNYTRSASQILLDYNSKAATAKGAGVVQGVNDQSPINNGLAGYWPLDASSGNASDFSGVANTLTNNNSTAYAAAKFGKGGSFVAASLNYFSTASTISNVQTVAFWINPSSNTDEYINLTSSAYITSSSGVVSATGFTSPSIYVNGVLNGTITASTWNHVVVTTSTAINANQFEVGRGNGAYTNGTMDEVRLYTRAFTQADVNQLYAFAPNALAQWEFEDGYPNNYSTVTDSSGNGNNAILYNGTYVPGKYGKAVLFNGTSTTASVSASKANFDFERTDSFTISAWYKQTAPGGINEIFSKLNPNSPNNGYELFQFSDNRFYFILSNVFNTNTLEVHTSTTITDTNWHHISLVYSGTSNPGGVKIYIDGQPDTLGTDANSLSATALNNQIPYIGSRGGTGFFANATIDHLQVYNYARTQSQVIQDLNAGHPLVGSPVASPVGYWKLDEGYGTTANNSGNIATISGALVGGALWTNDGKFGKAVSFNGANSYINLSDVPQLFTPGPFTVSAWVNPGTSTGANQYIFSDFETTGTTTNFSLQLRNSDRKFIFFFGDGSDPAVSNTVATIGNWYHIVGVYDGTSNKIYINGVLEGTTTQTQNHQSDKGGVAAIGRAGTPAVQWFRGKIDEVKYYNYGLTADQVKLDMNRQSSQVLGTLSDTSGLGGGAVASSSASAEYCIPGDSTSCNAPIGRWDFEEGNGSTTNDISGNANTATWNGTLGAQWNGIGKFGKGGNFNGTNNYLDAGTGLALSGDLTLEAWYKTSVSGAGQMFVSKGTTNDWLFSFFRNSDNTIQCKIYQANSASAYLAAITAANYAGDNKWHHAVCTVSSTTVSIYVDGVLSTSSSSTTGSRDVATAGNFYISNFQNGGTSLFWSGQLDAIRVFNYARTAAQIAWDYNRGGPVMWYKFDECQGNTINDSSGNGQTGTWSGSGGSQTSAGTCTTASTAWGNGANGKINSSLNFDGTDDLVNVTTSTLNNITGPITISAWVKPTDFSNYRSIVSKAGSGSSACALNCPFDFYINPSGQASLVRSNGSSAASITMTGSLTAGQWSHIVAVDNGTTYSIYVNGVLAPTSTIGSHITPTTSTGDVRIGLRLDSGTLMLGQLDDLRIFTYALTASQIKQVYNNGAIRFSPITGTP